MAIFAGTATLTTCTFTDPAGATTDPTTVTLKWSGGDGVITTWTYAAGQIQRVSAGVYQATISTDTSQGLPGGWTVEWEGTGTCAAVGVSSFTVETPPL